MVCTSYSLPHNNNNMYTYVYIYIYMLYNHHRGVSNGQTGTGYKTFLYAPSGRRRRRFRPAIVLSGGTRRHREPRLYLYSMYTYIYILPSPKLTFMDFRCRCAASSSLMFFFSFLFFFVFLLVLSLRLHAPRRRLHQTTRENQRTAVNCLIFFFLPQIPVFSTRTMWSETIDYYVTRARTLYV